MFILKLFRWLLGYVKFEASGGFAERFINLCAARKIIIRDVKIGGTCLTAAVRAKDYKRLRPIAKSAGMKLKAMKKSGLVFFIRKHKERAGLAVGACFFVLFISVSSLFIWNVEAVGAENVSAQQIIDVMKEIGLYEGRLKSSIDTYEMTQLAMMKLSGKVSWLAINIKGTHAVVEVRDYMQWREDTTYTEPCNIVADFDGLLLSVEAYNGQKYAKEGSGVKKGDLLISGIVENRDTSSQFMEARGKITALHTDVLQVIQKAETENAVYTSSESVRYLSLFGMEIPLGFYEKNSGDYTLFESEKRLNYAHNDLPFAIIERTRVYYEKGKIETSLCARAFDEYTTAAFEKYKNTLVLKSGIAVSQNASGIVVRGENECIDFMGVKQKISFD